MNVVALPLSAVDIQRVLAGLCVVGGVAILAGWGWALICTGAFLLIVRSSWDIAKIRYLATDYRQRLATSVQARGAAMMPVGVLGITTGLALAVGLGWGIFAGGTLLSGMSLYVDRKA